MYPWKTTLAIDETAAVPAYLQVANAVIREIMAGRLAPGQKMPGTRRLSAQLSVNRKTIIAAYDELLAQSWLEISRSRGTFIAGNLPLVKKRLPAGTTAGVYRTLEEAAFETDPPSGTLQAGQNASLLCITDGSPDVRLAPVAEIYKRCKQVASRASRRYFLRYGDVRGEESLREVLGGYLHGSRGLACSPGQILLTRGSQMGIYLAFHLLLRPGDKVLVSDPSYPAANDVIRECGGQILSVPVDEDGLDVPAVEALCRRHTIRAMYLTPHHHYPTTVTLSAERRMQLLRLAQQQRFAIIEDDYDYDFHYASSPLLPLASLDTRGVVIYIGSFTKCIAPGIRVGYVVAPGNIITLLAGRRMILDRQGDPVMERALATFIEDGELQRHLKKALKIYRQRRDDFCAMLEEQLGDHLRFRKPDGGMAVWATCKGQTDLHALDQYVLRRGVSLDGVEDWAPFRALRLGFASLNREEMLSGISVLREGIDRQL